MDLILLITQFWPIAVVVAVLGAVFTAFALCAVSHWIVRLAVWLYSSDPATRADRLEEWTSDLEEMKPAERPGHAGSLLWLGARMLPSRLLSTDERASTTDETTTSVVFALDDSGRPTRRLPLASDTLGDVVQWPDDDLRVPNATLQLFIDAGMSERATLQELSDAMQEVLDEMARERRTSSGAAAVDAIVARWRQRKDMQG